MFVCIKNSHLIATKFSTMARSALSNAVVGTWMTPYIWSTPVRGCGVVEFVLRTGRMICKKTSNDKNSI